MRHPVAQVGLIHGGGIEPVPYASDVYQLQPGSVARAERGVELFEAGAVDRLLFSGGNAHGHNLSVTEAQLMADSAVRSGVPASRIETEPTSSSTIGNWGNSLEILQEMGAESVLGVTGRIARPRAYGIGMALIRHYGIDIELTGYWTTKEPASPDAMVRELTAAPLAAAWLANAWRKGRSLSELEDAYRNRRAHSPVASVKERFTHR